MNRRDATLALFALSAAPFASRMLAAASVNLKTARAIGVKVAQAVLLRADRVIE